MLSLETAKKLKEAGLEWEPKEGDFIYYPSYCAETEFALGVLGDNDMGKCKEETLDYVYTGEWIIAPRLDQLLAEIEGQEYSYTIRYRLLKHDRLSDGYEFTLIRPMFAKNFKSEESPEEAAAAALIWILEQEAKA